MQDIFYLEQRNHVDFDQWYPRHMTTFQRHLNQDSMLSILKTSERLWTCRETPSLGQHMLEHSCENATVGTNGLRHTLENAGGTLHKILLWCRRYFYHKITCNGTSHIWNSFAACDKISTQLLKTPEVKQLRGGVTVLFLSSLTIIVFELRYCFIRFFWYFFLNLISVSWC